MNHLFTSLSVLIVLSFVPSQAAEEDRRTNEGSVPPLRGVSSNPSSNGAAIDESIDQFDFLVAGFPKCGTTTLLKAFAAHPETSMAAEEQCAVAAPAQGDPIVLKKLSEARESLVGEQTAFKCPNAIYTYKSFIRLEKHSPQVKLVIGIRHPVLMMQSYFNYRITEMYHKGGATEPVPDFTSLMLSGANWKGVNLGCTRFELFLMQLGKTDLYPSDFEEMSEFSKAFGYDMAVKPSNFQVFLYTVEQLDDTDEERSLSFRSALQSFLNLHETIPPFGHENKNHATGSQGYAESISICDPKYGPIRRLLIKNGIKASDWIVDDFIESTDVVVANPDHFTASLKSWVYDPCEEQVSSS